MHIFFLSANMPYSLGKLHCPNLESNTIISLATHDSRKSLFLYLLPSSEPGLEPTSLDDYLCLVLETVSSPLMVLLCTNMPAFSGYLDTT